MASFSSANVTYTINKATRLGDSKVYNNITLTFGNGTLTYATGGIPISLGNCGCPNYIWSMDIADAGTSGYAFNFNTLTQKLQIYTSGSHNHTLYVATNAGTAGTTALNAGTLGGAFVSGGTQAIAGIAAASGTLGGIVTTQPSGSLSELPNGTAPASLSLIVNVMGF
jgi:hypothetical protein